MNTEPEAIGLWTEIKLHIIREYAAAYTTILKGESWCRGYAYIDAFAGGGHFVSNRDRDRLIEGSTSQVVFSWSVNAEEVGAKWEHGTPLPSRRFSAAEKMRKAGWPIRFRLDPMIPVPDWQRGYAEAIKRINALSPEMVTLGALRATSYKGLRNAARSNNRDESIFDYLTAEKDPSGFKYRVPFHAQVEMFRFAIDRLKSTVKPALCKEDRALWKALGLRFDGCHCSR